MSSRHLWAGGVCWGWPSSRSHATSRSASDGLSVDFRAGKASDEWVRSYDIKPGGSLDNHQHQRPDSRLTGDGQPGRGSRHPRGQDRQRGGLARAAQEERDARGGHPGPRHD